MRRAWRSFEKKVAKFNDKYPSAHVICLAMVENNFVAAGNESMVRDFYGCSDIQNKFRDILGMPSQVADFKHWINPLIWLTNCVQTAEEASD